MIVCPICKKSNILKRQSWIVEVTGKQDANGDWVDDGEDYLTEYDDFPRYECVDCGHEWDGDTE